MSRWLLVGAGALAATVAAAAVGVPSPALLAALAVGVAYALTARLHPLELPTWALTVVQTLLGVTIGAQLQASTLQEILENWAPIALTSAATIVVSVVAGLSLARLAGVDRSTALLGMIAGGGGGIVAIATELDTDDRLVAFMQYLRVVIVVLAAPLLAPLLNHVPASAPPTLSLASGSAGLWTDLAFTVGCCAAGALIAHRLAFPASTLLVPLAVAAVLSVSGLVDGAQPPHAVQQLAFALIGLHVGLRFTADAIRRVGRLLPAVLATIAAILAACAGLGALLSALTGQSAFNAYLATTPGGLSAVLAVALGSGGNATFVLAVQTLRLVAMLVVAAPIVRILGTRQRPS